MSDDLPIAYKVSTFLKKHTLAGLYCGLLGVLVTELYNTTSKYAITSATDFFIWFSAQSVDFYILLGSILSSLSGIILNIYKKRNILLNRVVQDSFSGATLTLAFLLLHDAFYDTPLLVAFKSEEMGAFVLVIMFISLFFTSIHNHSIFEKN